MRKASEKTAGTVEVKMHTHKGWYLKYWNNEWKGERELADIMDRRNVDILYQQKTKWKVSKTNNIGSDCQLFYNKADGRKNGIEIVVSEDLVESVLELKRVSYRLMAMKLEVKGLMLNMVSACPPQFGNSIKEKNNFWQGLNELIEIVLK